MATLASGVALPGVSRAALEISVSDLASAEGAWRRLERSAIMAPYGRFDWVSACAAGTGAEIRVVIATDEAGEPVILLPVQIRRGLGARLATEIGGKHTNLTLPLVRPDLAATLDDTQAAALLVRMGRALQVDAFALGSVPAVWAGAPVAWAALGQPSPSDVASLSLSHDGETTLARSMSRDARKKLRNKSRGLAGLGEVEVVTARDEATADLLLTAFYRQKEGRFRELGIDDPFAEPAVRAFVRRGALAGLAAGAPAIELYGLRVGTEIAAVLAGAADAERLSGMMLSFDPGPAARFSPGEILVTGVIGLQCERGRRHFDLGVGDAHYKRKICDETIPLVDLVVPVTTRGQAYVQARRAATALKRRLKQSPTAMRAIATTRKRLAALRGA